MEPGHALENRFGARAPEIGDQAVSSVAEVMLEHRSCRSFDPKPVEDSLVALVLAAAMSAPSKSDLQQTTVLWLRDTELRSLVLDLLPTDDYAWVHSAPHVFVFCGDNRRLRRAAIRLGRPFPNDNLDQFTNAAVDTGIVLGWAVNAAASFGLGTCSLSELRDRSAELIKLLELPDGVFPVAGLALGWPNGADRQVSQRLPFAVRVQEDTYSDAWFDASFLTYEADRDRAEDRADDEQREVERFGVTRPYGWAEDRTRQYAVLRRADWGEHVRGQGFRLD